jgi:hypothetical protein
MRKDLENILTAQITKFETSFLTHIFDEFEAATYRSPRNPFGWVPPSAKAVGKFLENIVYRKDVFSYEKMKKELDNKITSLPPGRTPPAGGGAAISNHYTFVMDILRDICDYKISSIRGNEAAAMEALQHIEDKLPRYNMNHYTELKDLINFNRAKVEVSRGEFDTAYGLLNNGSLASDGEAALTRGILMMERARDNDAEKDLRIAYDSNPRKKEVVNALVTTYNRLARETAEPNSDYRAVDTAIVSVWKEGCKLSDEGNIPQAFGKFEQVSGSLAAPTDDAGKLLKARALHMQAYIKDRMGDIKSAIGYARQSVDVFATKNAYTFLSEIHTSR